MTEYSVSMILLFAPLFVFAVFIAFFIPGRLVLRNVKLTAFQSSVLAITLGIVLWGWQGFIFGFLGIRWVTYLYLLTTFIIWMRTDDKSRMYVILKNFTFKRPQLDWLLVLLITIGTIMQLTTIYLTGIQQANGLTFCCTIPDTLYHIALTNQLVTSVPPTEPGAAGIVVHNYHYLGNLVSADLVRIFHLPLIATQYQYLTILISLLIGLTAVTFGEILHFKKSYKRWLVLFLYFSGDLTFLLPLFFGGGINFNVPLLENALSLWASPPRVFALVVFMAALSILVLWMQKPKTLLGIVLAFMFSSLIGFKIYFGVFMAVGVTALTIYYIFTRQFKMLPPLILTGILSVVLYFPVNANAGGLIFIGHPWIFENFIAQQPVLSIQRLEMARQIYIAHHNWFGVARFEILYAITFFIFSFGTITLAFFQSKRSLALFPKQLNLFLIPGFIICLFLGSFFFQTIGGGNSDQFLITVDIFASIYAALACYYWINKLHGVFKYIVIVILVILTVPRVIHEDNQKIKTVLMKPQLVVNPNQLQALTYLKTQTPDGSIVLADNIPLPKFTKQIDTRTWTGDKAYYIDFLANRPLFIDGVIVQSHSPTGAMNKRKVIAHEILFNKNPAKTRQLLISNHISYLYMQTSSSLVKHLPPFLQVVLKNSTVTLLQFKTNS